MRLGFLIMSLWSINTWALDPPVFLNRMAIANEINLSSIFFRQDLRLDRPIKIAVLDNGFSGWHKAVGKTLPKNTEYHQGPIQNPVMEDFHGLRMAEMLYLLLTNGARDFRFLPAEFHLYNSFGYTNFKESVDDAISRKIDIILYSQVWEYGGNDDGTGFINTVVDKATQAGILWINAAGNFSGLTYRAPILAARDDWVELSGPNHSLEMRCESLQTCSLRAVLVWNDFKNNTESGTDKDLDLILTDDTLNILASSQLTQVKENPNDNPGLSLYPREILSRELDPGLYYLRVKNRSKNFFAGDEIRITVSGNSLTLPRGTRENTVFNPADNQNVITVGAQDETLSSFSLQNHKPEFMAPSHIYWSEHETFQGSSSAAAIVAAGVAIMKTMDRNTSRNALLTKIPNAPGRGLTLPLLGFTYTGPGCFKPLEHNLAAGYLVPALLNGGVFVETTAGTKILFPFDPLPLMPGIYRRQINDILVFTPGGPGIYHRSALFSLPPSFVEALEIPLEQRICIAPSTGPQQFRIRISSN